MDGGRGRDTDRRRAGIRIGVVHGYCRAATTGPPNPQKNRGPQWTKPGGKARTDEGTPDKSRIEQSPLWNRYAAMCSLRSGS